MTAKCHSNPFAYIFVAQRRTWLSLGILGTLQERRHDFTVSAVFNSNNYSSADCVVLY